MLQYTLKNLRNVDTQNLTTCNTTEFYIGETKSNYVFYLGQHIGDSTTFL